MSFYSKLMNALFCKSMIIRDGIKSIELLVDKDSTTGAWFHREKENGSSCDIDVLGSSTEDGYAEILLQAIARVSGSVSYRAYLEADSTTGATLSLYNMSGSGGDITLCAGEHSGDSSATIDGHNFYHEGNLDMTGYCRWRGTAASDPSDPLGGDIYYNTGDSKPYIYNGTAWIALI